MELPPDLRSLIMRGECTAFIGSGLSFDTFGGWEDLIKRLCARCEIPYREAEAPTTERMLELAEAAKLVSEQGYRECLSEHFGAPRPLAPTSIYLVLTQLKFKCYITTNFDYLLAKAVEITHGCHKDPQAYPDFNPDYLDKRAAYYLHGLIRENAAPEDVNIVLTSSEFRDAYDPNFAIQRWLGPVLNYHAICFVGCRLNEPALRDVFKLCEEFQEKAERLAGKPIVRRPRRYILLAEPHIEGRPTDARAELERIKNETIARYKFLGVEVVWYDNADRTYAALRRGFEDLAKSIIPKDLSGVEEGDPNEFPI